MKGQHHVFMEDTPGAAGGGAGAAAPAPAASPAPSPAPAPAPAAGGSDGAGGVGSSDGGSALAAGAGGDGAGEGGGGAGAGQGSVWERIPEKLQVKKPDGTLDHEATAAKVEEHRSNLEKRLGEGGVRPKTAAEYKFPDPPEALKGLAMDDAVATKFREDAHKQGLSQSQFDFVMGEYFKLAPALVGAGKQVSADETIASLKTSWGDNYDVNAKHAWRGMEQLAQAAGLKVDEVDAELGNSATFNRIMAAVGAQMREDTPPNVGGSGASAGNEQRAAEIQMSEAFRNPKHPGHQKALDDWHAIVTKGVADAPVI